MAVKAGSDGVGWAGVVPASVTGQTVVETAMVEVTTDVESAGQSVTVGAQLVIVISLVVKMVEVVHDCDRLAPEEVALTDEVPPAADWEGELAEGAGTRGVDVRVEAEAVSVTGQTVVETGIVEVTTEIDSAGQFVTVGAQLVTVISLVVKIVEVVQEDGLGTGAAVDSCADTGVEAEAEGVTGVGMPDWLGETKELDEVGTTTGTDGVWSDCSGVDDPAGVEASTEVAGSEIEAELSMPPVLTGSAGDVMASPGVQSKPIE